MIGLNTCLNRPYFSLLNTESYNAPRTTNQRPKTEQAQEKENPPGWQAHEESLYSCPYPSPPLDRLVEGYRSSQYERSAPLIDGAEVQLSDTTTAIRHKETDLQYVPKPIKTLFAKLGDMLDEGLHNKLSNDKNYTATLQKLSEIILNSRTDSEKIVELQHLAYRIFAGSDMAHGRAFSFPYIQDTYRLLTASFYVEEKPENIVSIFLTCLAFNDGKKSIVELPGILDKPLTIDGRKEDDLISISHGGGYYYLTEDFLKGRVSGDSKIWVTPRDEAITVPNRDIHYAVRTPLKRCDMGAVLTAKIPMKFLQMTNNLYELVLNARDVGQLKDVNIQKIEIGDIKKFGEFGDECIKNLLPPFLCGVNNRQKEVILEFKSKLQEYGLKPGFVDTLTEKMRRFGC